MRLQGGNVRLSEESQERLAHMEESIIESLFEEINHPDIKVKDAARKLVFSLGLLNNKKEAQGVVDFLLQRARQGEFGDQVKIWETARAREAGEDVAEEEYLTPDEYDEAEEMDFDAPVESKIPLTALGRNKPPKIENEELQLPPTRVPPKEKVKSTRKPATIKLPLRVNRDTEGS